MDNFDKKGFELTVINIGGFLGAPCFCGLTILSGVFDPERS